MSLGVFVPCQIENVPGCQPYPWHPSVLYVKKPFGGHCYWMAQTPLPPFEIHPYIDRFELPCIHYSDNGLDWKSISSNPIEDLTEEQIQNHDYYSDPHLVLKDGLLECYYRLTVLKGKGLVGSKTLLCKKTSLDGNNWSERIVVADLRLPKDYGIWGRQIISPSLVWRNGKYKCWYVDASSYEYGRNVRLVDSFDGFEWSKNQICVLEGCDIDPWHIDVQCYDSRYYLLVYDYQKLLLFVSEDEGKRFVFVNEILEPSHNAYDFYADGLYRACSINKEKEYWVYFSARRKERTYIGCLKTSDWKSFKGINGQSCLNFYFRDIFPFISRKELWRPIKKRIKGLMGL